MVVFLILIAVLLVRVGGAAVQTANPVDAADVGGAETSMVPWQRAGLRESRFWYSFEKFLMNRLYNIRKRGIDQPIARRGN